MLETLAAALVATQGGYPAPSPRLPMPRTERSTTAQAPTPTPQPTVAAVPGKSLRDLPNVTIRYFEVTGKNFKAINKSMARQQQKDAQGRLAAPPTSWALDTTFSKTTGAAGCRITTAKANFSANASLPRLVPDRAHKPELLAAWRSYLANIENMQAANLWFVYDRKGDVEKAILAASCETAQSAGAAAVQRLRAQAAEFRRQHSPISQDTLLPVQIK